MSGTLRDTYAGCVRVPSLIETLPDRWRDPSLPAYPWWIPVVFFTSAFVCVGAGVGQRLGTDDFWPVAGLALVALVPWFADVAGRCISWVTYAVFPLAGVGLAVSRYPVDYDLLPALLPVLAGHFGATERYWRGKLATAVTVAVIALLGIFADFGGALLWGGAIVIAWDIGVVMQFQQRRIDEAAINEERRREQALLAERQRIAREVHDVVAHSLSVTMLHLTAARRELEQDGAEGVPDAIDALRDAEQVGRQAMTDIRRTVGVLAEGGPVEASANPDLADVPALVDGFRSAGLQVDLDVRGAVETVPPNAALALYRIVQESLANVAKHQPHAPTSVLLDVTDGQRVVVANPVSHPVTAATGGAGLTGMAQRADLLGGTFRAGAAEGRWVVEVVVPRTGAACIREALFGTPAPAAGTT